MSRKEKSPKLNHFSWEDWDGHSFVVLHRSERRFVVKRYIERVLSNSARWLNLAKNSFCNIEPVPRTHRMTQNDVKLMQNIFTWHCNGTLKIPIVAGLDEFIDFEDLLDFIERVETNQENHQPTELTGSKSSSMVPTIPIGVSDFSKRSKGQKSEKTMEISPTKIAQTQKTENISNPLVSLNNWIQINNVFIPYIVKSEHGRVLPYQVLVDCDLLTESEQNLLNKSTIPASQDDICQLEKIIASSSTINFTLDQNLVLITLQNILFGIKKVPYVKLLNQHLNVNKAYKTVMMHKGGIIRCQSFTMPYIHLGKLNYVLLDSCIKILDLSPKISSNLRRRSVYAQLHELDFLRLVDFYSNNCQQENNLSLYSNESQLLISVNEISRQVDDVDLLVDWSLADFHCDEHVRMKNNIEISSNRVATRKTTKRKASTPTTQRENITNDP